MRLFCVRLLALSSLVLAVCGPLPARAADISVVIDQAQLVKLPDRASTIVIGNPVIADAAVQSGGWVVLTGKSFGSTNIIAIDRSGAVLMEKSIDVQGPRDAVTVYRGSERVTYSCTPECERRLMLGDFIPVFEATAAQIAARNGLAAGTPNR
jgi:Pilus formation protein N terminal region